MNTLWRCFQRLGVAIVSATVCELSLVAFYANYALAQITPDATLPNNSSVIPQANTIIIEGGTTSGSNLFHSFKEFSVPADMTADFQNAVNVQNIITRVTGKSVSDIYGRIRARGTANLFLINPNGIIFGPNASLDIGGSFIGSTASSINFTDDIKFSATEPQNKPLLTVNVPTGLQFGATAAPIRNQSQASHNGATNIFGDPAGLQVRTSKTLVLLGGDINLEGGNLTALEGRIELGSVAENSLVSLDLTEQGWILGYKDVDKFQNIQLNRRNIDSSFVPSIVDASGEEVSGSIQVQGKYVELIGRPVRLITQNRGIEDGGELKIGARKLIIRDGAQILTSTLGQGRAGNLVVDASESVEVIGVMRLPNGDRVRSLLSTAAFATGNAGDITINTRFLRLQDGGSITVQSSGDFSDDNTQFIPAKGVGGNLIVNASEFVELTGKSARGLSSGLFTETQGSGDAGNLTIVTKQLIVRDGAEINLNSEIPDPENVVVADIENFGTAGSLTVNADSIRLENGGKIRADTRGGGGNIFLNSPLSILRNNSSITTNAAGANIPGGNITIDAKNGFIIANENSDITANSTDSRGGNISILNAQRIFGIEPRDKKNPNTSDITATGATSEESGNIEIEQFDAEPDQNILEINSNLVDASQLINQNFCAVKSESSSFTITGRGGLPPSPNDVLDRHNVWEDWRLNPVRREVAKSKGKEEKIENNIIVTETVSKPVNKIVQAQRAIINKAGEVVLVADAATPPSFGNSPSCK